MKAYTSLLYILMSLPLAATDQSYTQFAPKAAPSTTPAPGGYDKAPEPRITKSGEDGEVLCPRVKGLVFVGSTQDIIVNGTSSKDKVTIRDVTVPDEAGFKGLVRSYVGRPLTRGQLNEMITKIIVFHRKHDRPVVDVIVPQQDINNGFIQLLLLESKVGKVIVSGNHWFPSQEIRDNFHLQPGDQISSRVIQEDLAQANANPFHTSDVVYQPGNNIGTTDVDIQTKDRFPVRVYAGYEDSGNQETGLDRYIAGLNWGDAFEMGLGHQLNYQYTTSGDGRSLQAHSGSYVIPLPDNQSLTLFGDFVTTKGTIPPLINVTGESYQGSARYSVTLPDISLYNESVSFGFDHKYNDNSLQFGNVPITGVPNEVNQFALVYDGSLTDTYGTTSLDFEGYYSPGGIGQDNDNFDFNAAHTGATADYEYADLTLQRLQKLPWEWSFLLKGTFQTSSANLVPSEQLGFGGYDTVRGYDEREFNADEGYIINAELRTPSISAARYLNWGKHFDDELQFLAFFDYGDGYNHTRLPGEPNETTLSSVGGGARYTINTNLSVRADYGFQLHNTGLDRDHGSRGDIGIVISY